MNNLHLATQIAPALRMIFAPDGKAYVSYSNENNTTASLYTCENRWTEDFTTFCGKNTADKETVQIDGIGCFTIEKEKKDKPLSGKIAVVTGSAQGFGAHIAEYLCSQGARVALADMNYGGVCERAEFLSKTYDIPTLPIMANVSDEASVRDMIQKVVLSFGGLDIFINNAGIVRAGSLEEMTKENFELVTSVDYTAYFLCVKYAAEPMKIQRACAQNYMADIIEINSKSGLEGSNKNFAYAGAKFGGIGLTQSFALELAPFGIKVNAICPGNFLDGPLWSDPDRGLFVQYLKAGKVPGAKTVADVRAAYEAKVPLGRGCRAEDVNRAIAYIIEQKYETGQALPVTGGQTMLN